MIRPKKERKDVCPFPTDPKYWKIRVVLFFFFFFYTQFCIVKQKCWNKMSKYIVTVPKRYFNQIKWNTIPSNTRIKPIWVCMPKNAHTHEWCSMSSVFRFKEKERKIDLLTLPIFKPFIFSGLLKLPFWQWNYNHQSTFIWRKDNNSVYFILLNAGDVDKFLEMHQISAAVKLQAIWRGVLERKKLGLRKATAHQVKAAITIQRCVSNTEIKLWNCLGQGKL